MTFYRSLLYLAAKVNVESLLSIINLDICDLISKTLLASLETNSLKSDFSNNNSEKIKTEYRNFVTNKNIVYIRVEMHYTGSF